MQSNLKLLVPFAEIAKCGSFAGAAAQLGVTPSAVTKSMARLESILGMRLFNRTTRRLHLTAEGEKLLKQIDPLLAGLNMAVDSLQAAGDQPSGKIKLSVGTDLGRYTLMPALVEFTRLYPQVDIQLYLEDLPGDLVDKGFDLGIHTNEVNESRYVSRSLVNFPLILVASPDYLDRYGVPQTPHDLLQHQCIGILSASGKPREWIFSEVSRRKSKKQSATENIKIVPQGQLSLGTHHDSNVSAALVGAGIALTSLPTAVPFLRQRRLKVLLRSYRVINPSSSKSINIFYPHREYLPLKVRALIDFLVDRIKSHGINADELRGFLA